MASINNPASVAAVAAKGGEGQKAAVAEAGALAREIQVQPTGVAGEQGQPRSGFDVMAHRYISTNPAADEAFRDTVSLQPHFGQDQLMGARQFDPALMDYLAGKRDQAIRRKYDDLILTMYDPLEPSQRAALEAMMPSLVQSKLQVFQMCQEQKDFIAQCAIRAMGQLGGREVSRLIRILGAGEPLLRHPIDDALNGEPQAGDGGPLGSALRGIFSFLTASPGERTTSAYPEGQGKAGTRIRRVAIAKLCLHHFPRYLTGSYSSFSDDGDSKRRAEMAADRIVEQCERFIDQMVPLGNFATDLAAAASSQGGKVNSVQQGTIDGMFLADSRR